MGKLVKYEVPQLFQPTSIGNIKISCYCNRMNNVGWNHLTVRETRLYMTIMGAMFEKGTEQLCFTFSGIKKAIGMDKKDSNEDVYKLILSTGDKLAGTYVKMVSDTGKFANFVLFPTFIGDLETKTLTVRTNSDFLSMINNLGLANRYTEIKLETFNSINGKYAQSLYRLLKQFYNSKSKSCFITAEQMRQVFEFFPQEGKKFNSKALYPAIEELKKTKDYRYLRLDAQKMKGQRPVEKYYFRWDKEDKEDV